LPLEKQAPDEASKYSEEQIVKILKDAEAAGRDEVRHDSGVIITYGKRIIT
jgi:hypothetical protein